MTPSNSATGRGYLRIATEEAYAPIEVLDEYRRLLQAGGGDLGFKSIWGYYGLKESERTRSLVERIQDLGDRRLADMAQYGIDHQVVSLTMPGLDLFDASLARELARVTNDRIADACSRRSDRFSGLAAVTLQDVDFSVSELERAVIVGGLRGLIVNSHASGVYLDDPRFDPLFAAAERLGVPVYLHPNTPPDRMIEPLLSQGLEGAILGFAVETSMHLLRIIFSGVFDRFPRLQLVVGHLGEGLPFWLHRVDYFYAMQARAGSYPNRAHLDRRPSEYLKENVWMTSSGMGWEPAIMFTREVVGLQRVIYAMDYPYQVSAEEVATQDRLPISAEDKRFFFETGACQLFGLQLPALASATLSA